MHTGLNKKEMHNVTNIGIKMCMWGVRIKKISKGTDKRKESKKGRQKNSKLTKKWTNAKKDRIKEKYVEGKWKRHPKI